MDTWAGLVGVADLGVGAAKGRVEVVFGKPPPGLELDKTVLTARALRAALAAGGYR